MMIKRSAIWAIILLSLSTFAFADTDEKPAFSGTYFGVGSGFYLPQATSGTTLSIPGQTINANTKNDFLSFDSVWEFGHLWALSNGYRIGAEFQWRILSGISSHNHSPTTIGSANIYGVERDVSWAMQYAEDFVFGKMLSPTYFLFGKAGLASEVMETHTSVISDSYDPNSIDHYGEMYIGGNVGIGMAWLLAKQVSFGVEYDYSFFQKSNGKTDYLDVNAPNLPWHPSPVLSVKQDNLLSGTQTVFLTLDYFFK